MLLRFVESVTEAWCQSKRTTAFFVDVVTFDRVLHEDVLYKLKDVLPDCYVRFIDSFLRDSLQCEKALANTLSSETAYNRRYSIRLF